MSAKRTPVEEGEIEVHFTRSGGVLIQTLDHKGKCHGSLALTREEKETLLALLGAAPPGSTGT
jgi:hypothetical protein